MARDVRLGAGSKTHEHDTLAKWTLSEAVVQFRHVHFN
jgi:hypothetical protein